MDAPHDPSLPPADLAPCDDRSGRPDLDDGADAAADEWTDFDPAASDAWSPDLFEEPEETLPNDGDFWFEPEEDDER